MKALLTALGVAALLATCAVLQYGAVSGNKTLELLSSQQPVALQNGGDSNEMRRVVDSPRLKRAREQKLGMFNVKVTGAKSCQDNGVSCAPPPPCKSCPKPPPVSYRKEVNMVGFGPMSSGGKAQVTRRELEEKIKWLRHTMDSLRHEIEFVKLQRGPRGKEGSPGAQGADGRDGQNGTPGRDGDKGDRGRRGKRGKQGDKGAPGKNGKPGFVAGGGFTMQTWASDKGFKSIPDMTSLKYIGSGTTDLIDLPTPAYFQSIVPGTPGTNFAWRFFGKTLIKKKGGYTLCTTSIRHSRLFIDRKLLIDNNHINFEVCKNLLLEPGLHEVYLEGYTNSGGGAVAKLQYMGPDTFKGKKKGQVLEPMPSVDSRAPPPPLPSRFTVRVFASANSLSSVPNFEDLEYVGEGIVPKVDFKGDGDFRSVVPTTPNSNYAWQIFGRTTIATGGLYKLCIASDDGSMLYVDEKLEVDNDGLHGTVKKCKDLHLVPGGHDIRVDGFQAGGGVAMMAYISGPDTYGHETFLRSMNPIAPPVEKPSEWLIRMYRGHSGMTAIPRKIRDLHMEGEAVVPVIDFHGGSVAVFRKYMARTPISNSVFEAFGKLRVANKGVYTFCSKSKDGSKIFVDGLILVNNDGLHGVRTRCGDLNLETGIHLIKVEGFHGGGRVWNTITYKGLDTSRSYVLLQSVGAAAF